MANVHSTGAKGSFVRALRRRKEKGRLLAPDHATAVAASNDPLQCVRIVLGEQRQAAASRVIILVLRVKRTVVAIVLCRRRRSC